MQAQKFRLEELAEADGLALLRRVAGRVHAHRHRPHQAGAQLRQHPFDAVLGLQSTQEGRLALIDFMNEVMKTRMRFAQEANKMAEGNRGILPSEWNTRRARIMKEEMARLAVINKQIAQRFQNGGN